MRFLTFVTTLLLGFLFLTPASRMWGQEPQVSEQHAESDVDHATPAGEEKFNASEYILEHIADSHEWHILTKPDGEHVSVYLPVILYSKHSGIHLFSSRKLAHGHSYKGFQMGHGTLGEKSLEGKIIEVDANGQLSVVIRLSM